MKRSGIWEEPIGSDREGRRERRVHLEESQDGIAKCQEKKAKLE